MSGFEPAPIDNFFQPRGVAIVGASATPGSPNNQMVHFAKRMSLNGKIFPVNPKVEEIAGLSCFPNLMAIPDPVDLVVLAVGPKNCMAIAHEIKARRQKHGDAGAVAVVTAGFKEMGTIEGEQLQENLIQTIKSSGARVIGPNCQGVADVYNGVNTSFTLPPDVAKGGVTIISQSGAFATSYLRWGKDQKLVGISKFVSLGNMADLNITDLLEYVETDEKTKAIAVYMEGIQDARKMFDVAARVARKKPIVVMKAGRTAMGSCVAQSHTASIAGNNEIYDGAFLQAGIVRARSVADFYHTSRSFAKLPIPQGNRICIITVIGGPSTICVDELVSTGEAVLAKFSDQLKAEVAKHLSASANIGNPDGYIDMTASVTPIMHTEVLSLLMQEDSIDGIIFMTTPPGFLKDEELAQAIVAGYNSVPATKRKPLLSVLMAGNAVSKCRTILEENDLPTFEYPDDAARVMINMVRYGEFQRRNPQQA